MSDKENSKNEFKKSTYIHIIIGTLLMWSGFILPPVATLTEVGMKILFIFIGVIYLWSTVETLWSSLMALIAFCLSGYTTVSAGLTSSLGNSIVLLVFFIMVFFGGVMDSGVTRYISHWFLSRKISNGRPYVFICIFALMAFVISALTNPMTSLLLAWTIAYGILHEVGYTSKDKFAKFFIFATFIGAILGQITLPFTGSKLALVKAFENAFGFGINYLIFIVFDVIMMILVLLSLCLLCKFVYRCDISKMKNFSIDQIKQDALPPMSKTQKIYLVSCFAYIASILIATTLTASTPVIGPLIGILKSLDATGITIVWVLIFCIVRVDGKPLLNFAKIAANPTYVQYSSIFLVAVAVTMSSALTNDATGIKPLILNFLGPILDGNGQYFSAVLLTVVSFILTNFANNFVCGSILMPIWGTYAAAAGISTTAAPAIATMSLVCLYLAFLTPAASPFAGMLFANREWLSPSDILKFGLPLAIVILVLYSTVGYALSLFLFGFVA